MQLNPEVIKAQIAHLRHAFGELEADEETWLLALESETDLHEIIRHIERRRQEAAHMAGSLEEWMIEIQTRQRRLEQRERSLRTTAFRLMETAEVRKLEMAEATYSIRNGQPKLVGDADPLYMPTEFQRRKIELDREAIKQALKAGQTVTGFTLSNAEPTLAISTK